MSDPTTFDRAAFAALPATAGFAADLRAQAFAEFEALPLPSPETEEWRYTDLSAFALDHAPFTGGGSPEDRARQGIREAGEVGERAGFQVQRNSEVIATERATGLPDGVWFGDLDRAIREVPDLVEPYLAQLVPAKRTRFTALHAAFRTGGTFVHVPADTRVALPLQTLTWVDADGSAVFPHTLLVAERGAEVTFIDRFASPDLGRAFSDAVSEIVVGDGAHVRYVSIQEWGRGMTHLGIVRATLGRDAEIRTVSIGFGADLARVESEVILADQGGFSEQLGVFFADETQHFDHRTEQDHVAPNCTSDLLYKGALRDASRGVFSGWVHVRPGAQKTDAMQTSRNVILSESAFARAIPNLEIEANDVRCGHAASVGPVDEEQRFYLESRGIPAKLAERLIVAGFFNEVLERITLEEVRASVSEAIERELAREDA